MINLKNLCIFLYIAGMALVIVVTTQSIYEVIAEGQANKTNRITRIERARR